MNSLVTKLITKETDVQNRKEELFCWRQGRDMGNEGEEGQSFPSISPMHFSKDPSVRVWDPKKVRVWDSLSQRTNVGNTYLETKVEEYNSL